MMYIEYREVTQDLASHHESVQSNTGNATWTGRKRRMELQLFVTDSIDSESGFYTTTLGVPARIGTCAVQVFDQFLLENTMLVFLKYIG
jgi:hypothetical protein